PPSRRGGHGRSREHRFGSSAGNPSSEVVRPSGHSTPVKWARTTNRLPGAVPRSGCDVVRARSNTHTNRGRGDTWYNLASHSEPSGSAATPWARARAPLLLAPVEHG